MERRIGFIGAGMMAEALIAGALSAGLVSADRMIASDVSEARRLEVEKRHGIRVTGDNREVAAFADILVLAIKPQHAGEVLDEIGSHLDSRKTRSLHHGRRLDCDDRIGNRRRRASGPCHA